MYGCGLEGPGVVEEYGHPGFMKGQVLDGEEVCEDSSPVMNFAIRIVGPLDEEHTTFTCVTQGLQHPDAAKFVAEVVPLQTRTEQGLGWICVGVLRRDCKE